MPRQVLVVDDSSVSLYLAESLLKGFGLSVITARNGREALDKARSDPPDLIITDILMPVMDGYALCREWKADERLRHIPLIFYTATYTGGQDEAFALGLGADRFLIKPQEPDVLMRTVREVLAERYRPRQATGPLGEEMEFFRKYNEALFRKLEKKMTDLEEANRQLKTMEDRYRLSFDNVSDVVYMIDTDLHILSISPSVGRILGYEPEDFVGRSAYELKRIFTPESFEQALADAGLILKGETIPATIYRVVTRNGKVKCCEVSGSPVRRDGRVAGIIAVARDITDRIRAEEALQRSEKRYRELYDFLPVPVYEMDLEGRITAVNMAICELLGGSESEWREGVEAWRLLSPEGRKAFRRDMRKLSDGEKTTSTEYMLRRLDGSAFPAIIVSSAVCSDGRPVGFRGAIVDMTERREQDQKLRVTNAFLNSIVENMPDMIFLKDVKDLRFVRINRAGEELLGQSRDDLLGRNDYDFFPKDQADFFTGKDREVLEKRRLLDIPEERILTHNRGERVLHTKKLPILNERGEPEYLLGISEDITDRKRSEELYQILAERSLGVVFIVQAGRFRFISRSASAYIGDSEDLLGRDARTLIHPDDRAMAADMARDMLTGARTTAYEYRIVTSQNRVRWVSQIVAPVLYEGRPAVLGNALDMTDLKESQARLEESKALESSIMSAIPHVVIGFQDERILFINEAAETVFGWKPEELIGRKLDVLFQHGEVCRELAGYLGSETEGGPTCRREAEIRCRRRDGGNIFCKVTSCRIEGPTGYKTVVIMEDVTDKKMSHIQLLQAEKMASIGKLAAGVAHEINNPTAFVSSNLKTLAEYITDIIAVDNEGREVMGELRALTPGEPVPESIRERLRRIEDLESRLKIDLVHEDVVALIAESRDGTERISRIVQDLKNFAHPGEEKESLFDINENIESTLSIVWNELKYKAVVHKDYGDVPRLMGYPQQLNQVFMNLLVNAAQAIVEKGEIRISTRTDDGVIEIRIADTGTGIPPENLPKLFDPFFTTKEVGKGTGLGLHVAYTIIEKHRGSIDVESTVGVGTTFIIRIPVQAEY